MVNVLAVKNALKLHEKSCKIIFRLDINELKLVYIYSSAATLKVVFKRL